MHARTQVGWFLLHARGFNTDTELDEQDEQEAIFAV